MIFNALLFIASKIVTWILSLFPISTGYPSSVFDIAQTVGSYLYTFDFVLPISTLYTCFFLFLSVQLSIYAFKSAKWIISHIPWIGGRG